MLIRLLDMVGTLWPILRLGQRESVASFNTLGSIFASVITVIESGLITLRKSLSSGTSSGETMAIVWPDWSSERA